MRVPGSALIDSHLIMARRTGIITSLARPQLESPGAGTLENAFKRPVIRQRRGKGTSLLSAVLLINQLGAVVTSLNTIRRLGFTHVGMRCPETASQKT